MPQHKQHTEQSYFMKGYESGRAAVHDKDYNPTAVGLLIFLGIMLASAALLTWLLKKIFGW
jgi:hypothetical protein